MGIHIGFSSNKPRRAWYPSGPWIGGVKPVASDNALDQVPPKKRRPKKQQPKLPNPDPMNYKIEKVHEDGAFLIIKINYPDCTNFEGNKILVFRDTTLVDLVNQKYIDPHFFQDANIKSPIARFIPTDEGWQMATKFVQTMRATG